MAKITIDTDALLDGASQIGKCISNITEINSGLDSMIQAIGGLWKGSSSESYIGLMHGYAGKAKEMCNILQEYQNYVEQSAETFTKLDSDSANKIRSSF